MPIALPSKFLQLAQLVRSARIFAGVDAVDMNAKHDKGCKTDNYHQGPDGAHTRAICSIGTALMFGFLRNITNTDRIP